MAFIHEAFCGRCNKRTQHNHGTCLDCRKRAYDEIVEEWNKLSLEEKLNDLRVRIEKLESGPTRFK